MSKRFLSAAIVFVLLFGCATGSVKDTPSPTISEAQAPSPTGPKARIAVAQFVNNTGGWEGQMQRLQAQQQATMANLSRDSQELMQKSMEYQAALMDWQAKVDEVGRKKAGPPPKPPDMRTTRSPYTTTISDPVAGGIRDMMIKALFNSGRFIVLERQEIEKINWEQEFSRSDSVGKRTAIPTGKIEGAELLVIGSLNTLEAEQSGGDVGGVISSVVDKVWYLPYTKEVSSADIKWANAKTAMEIRLVDTRTSRIVAAFTAEGTATSGGFGVSRTQYTYNAGDLPVGISAYKKTPVEDAFRKMVDAAVQFIVTKTPDNYYHYE
jgi:curli biogenesis system outer membrane secretion channel CsgG